MFICTFLNYPLAPQLMLKAYKTSFKPLIFYAYLVVFYQAAIDSPLRNNISLSNVIPKSIFA